MSKQENKESSSVVVLGKSTSFQGLLKFKETLWIQGKFSGTIEAAGALVVDKDAVVEADRISVSSLTVYGTVSGAVHALDKIDMCAGAHVRGDLTAARLRIADGVLFEGQCSMTSVEKDMDIFSQTAEEIKAELRQVNG
ncbi:MAG TPA: hypothetical protein DEQ14_02635 [Treponema sp.]|nr:hypothetical protein [Treponema sp.]